MAGLVRHVSVTALLDLRRKVRIIFQGAFRLGPPRPIVRPGKARRSGNLYSAHSCLTVPSISPNTFTFNNGLLFLISRWKRAASVAAWLPCWSPNVECSGCGRRWRRLSRWRWQKRRLSSPAIGPLSEKSARCSFHVWVLPNPLRGPLSSLSPPPRLSLWLSAHRGPELQAFRLLPSRLLPRRSCPWTYHRRHGA
jgi:hypothetical protein